MYTVGIISLGILLIAYNPISLACWLPFVARYSEKKGYEITAFIMVFAIYVLCVIGTLFILI